MIPGGNSKGNTLVVIRIIEMFDGTLLRKLNPIFSTAVDRSKRLPVVVNELDKKSGGHSKVVAA